MLTETLSGKCPCCNYDKLLQRYGSQGYYQLDGCPNCGFGYGSNHSPESEDVVGEGAWLDYAQTILASVESDKYDDMFEDDPSVVREGKSIIYNGGQCKERKAYEHSLSIISKLSKSEIRERIFKWAEQQDRSNDMNSTVFKYTEDDVKNYLATNPVIFKQVA
jgi:hypothetical protein